MNRAGDRKIRVLLTKFDLETHDRGLYLISKMLKDAGMEVIYSGRHNSPEQLVQAAIQEDVDILGVSILSGAHMSLCQRIAALLHEKKADGICFVLGGFIPDEDVAALKAMGVQEVFGVGSSIDSIIRYFGRAAAERKI